MTALNGKVALIVGAGSGLSASIARRFTGAGMKVALASRGSARLSALAGEIGAAGFSCGAATPDEVNRLFAEVAGALGDPYAVVYNASYRTRGPLIDLDAGEVEKAIAIS